MLDPSRFKHGYRDVRPRRAPKPAPQGAADVDDGAGHLPAFLLRPFRVKA